MPERFKVTKAEEPEGDATALGKLLPAYKPTSDQKGM